MIFMDLVKISSSTYGLMGLFNYTFANIREEWFDILLIQGKKKTINYCR